METGIRSISNFYGYRTHRFSPRDRTGKKRVRNSLNDERNSRPLISRQTQTIRRQYVDEYGGGHAIDPLSPVYVLKTFRNFSKF